MKAFIGLLISAATLFGQTWSGSGSTGSDGPLDLGADSPGVVGKVLIFDPVALNLDVDADNVYNFTTITIRDNITVRFQANKTRRPGPVVFLATGLVIIGGKLIFDGEEGHIMTNNDSLRRVSIPGPGGYPGGIGGRLSGAPPTAGMGPGGGLVHPNDGNFFRSCPGAYTNPVIPSWCQMANSPSAYETNLLQPLVGGSGGSGAWGGRSGLGGAGGGAGGGAFRLASSVAIVFGVGLSGTTPQGCDSGQYYITANGGSGGSEGGGNRWAGGGAGGGIHLQAPMVLGCGYHAIANGGFQNDVGYASEGRIRIDTTSNLGVNTNPPATTNLLTDAPLPPNQPFLRISSINGVAVPLTPKFDYASPDVLINITSPVPIVFQASNIPVNTPVTVFITTDAGVDLTATVNLTGSLASSTATTSIPLPLGTARLIARAVW